MQIEAVVCAPSCQWDYVIHMKGLQLCMASRAASALQLLQCLNVVAGMRSRRQFSTRFRVPAVSGSPIRICFCPCFQSFLDCFRVFLTVLRRLLALALRFCLVGRAIGCANHFGVVLSPSKCRFITTSFHVRPMSVFLQALSIAHPVLALISIHARALFFSH